MRVPGGLFLFAHFNGDSGRYRIPSVFNVASNAFLIHAKKVCVYKVWAQTSAALFRKPPRGFTAVERSWLETETHRGIKGISVS